MLSAVRRCACADLTNVKHMYCVTPDSEQDAVSVGLSPIEKLSDFEREAGILGSESTTRREVGERCNGLVHRHEPAETRLSRVLRRQPFKN